MRWITRHEPHFDRCASIWLIKTFIDREAVFDFVSEDMEIPRDAVAFTLSRAEIKPGEKETTYDVLMKRYRVEDPVAGMIGEMIRDFEIDAGEDLQRVKLAETAGFFSIVRGLARTSRTDSEILFKAMVVMDALYAQLESKLQSERGD